MGPLASSFLFRFRWSVCSFPLLLLWTTAILLLPARLPAAELLVSLAPDRSAPQSLDAAPLTDLAYIFVAGADNLDQVRFDLDGSEVKTENQPPWDFAGTTPDDLAIGYDTRNLVDGNYQVRARLYQGGVLVETLQGLMQVANQPPPAPGGDAAQLHMGWQDDPASSLAIVWFSPLATTPAAVSYRRAGTTAWLEASGAVNHVTADGRYLKVSLGNLLAETGYEFRVALAPEVWSRVYQGRTAPAAGAADFDAVFVADTGLVGRLDGLATGTADVIAAVAARSPDVVLLGGDYAYFDTDKRYVTLERTIAAWFDQMAAVAGQSPLMPVYGNHEVLLGEGYDTWVRYFPTPEGWNNRRMYSFDAGDIHFVAIFGLNEYETLPQDALDWLTGDLAEATSRGQRWLVPYFHAAPFSEGTNHSSALPLRGQLGPIFEAAGVQVVLTAHDQSYERTFPLVNVPAGNTPTSDLRHCYGPGDGVSWLKIAPGGKLSNISKDFSPWKTPEPPYWTVFRDNSLHHFAHLAVSATGTLDVEVFGVAGDGSPPLRIDRVRYSVNGCEPELAALPAQVSFSVEPGEVASQLLQVASRDGAAQLFEVSQVPDWLSLSVLGGLTPASVELVADSTGLAPGDYRGILEIAAGEDNATWLPVNLRVGGTGYGLWVSDNPQRTGARPLESAQLQGEQYVFTSPDTDVTRVRFYLDDVSGTGTVTKTENLAPFDLAGTAPDDTAYPYDTAALADGNHELGARLTLAGGLEILVGAGFVVANDGPQLAVSPDSLLFELTPPQILAEASLQVQMSDGGAVAVASQTTAAWLTAVPETSLTPEILTVAVDAGNLTPGQYQGSIMLTAGSGEQTTVPVTLIYDLPSPYSLMVSQWPDRSAPVALSGALLAGDVYIFVPEIAGIKKVLFFLDDPDRLNSPLKVENNGPWDFAGTITKPPRYAYPFSLQGLVGQHVVTAVVSGDSGEEVIHGVFEVSP
ncbi:fibronectin type III domain-containing protein [Marinobacter profundi]|uniref:Calcineurin-like phosphoesterase domain-containing protein n=1 Tax=Marinobacter profundi TaxID=2666256 RepID=A0A2G1UHG5_9GAMM|nr:fibronectin type III domain-containing protein [Marinobacter profundi]PHQ13885.1 hypothetical protein CLH61_16420 [Marinobacter profundi]